MARRRKKNPPAQVPAPQPAAIPEITPPPSTGPSNIRMQLMAQLRAEWSGPLPAPDILIRYNDALPNGAERVVAMAERQSAHRIEMENRHQSGEHLRSILGSTYGLVVALALIVGSVWLISLGHELSGTILGTIDIVALVSVFVYGTERRRRERLERTKLMTEQRQPPGRR